MQLKRSFFALVLWGMALPAEAQLSGMAPLPGDTTPGTLFGRKEEPQVGAGNGQYMAVWNDSRMSLLETVFGDPWEGFQSDVYAERLAADGTPIDGIPILVDGSPFSQVKPRVACNGTDWLVVFESRSVSSTGLFTTRDIRAVRISGAGAVLDAEPLAIDTRDNEPHLPVVASDGSGWAVLWSDFGIHARTVGQGGNLGPIRGVTQAGSFTGDLAVAFARDRYLLVWEGAVIRGRFLDSALNPIGPGFRISTTGENPEVATDGTDFFVTISDISAFSEIRGTVVRRTGKVVNPGGVVFDGGSFLAASRAPVAWDGSSYVSTFVESQFSFPNTTQFTVRYNRMDSNGVPLFASPPSLVSSSSFTTRLPVAASLGTGDAFLGWFDDRGTTQFWFNGVARIVDAADVIAPERDFTVGPPSQMMPDLVSGPVGRMSAEDIDLAVYISAGGAETRVVFQRINGAGAVLDAEPIVLAGGSDRFRKPVAAWNGVEWLVAFEDETGGSGNGGILALRVRPDGSVPDATPIPVLDGNTPDVGALRVSGGDFLVAASKLASGDMRTLVARRVGADGVPLGGAAQLLGGNYSIEPTVEGFDDRWLVAWRHQVSENKLPFSIQARIVLAGGSLQPLLDPTTSTTTEFAPDLCIRGDLATLVWADGFDIRLRQIQKDGTGLGVPSGLVVSPSPGAQLTPTVGHDGRKAVVTWVDYRNQGPFEPLIGDLFGARLDRSLTLLDPDGVALLSDPKAPEGEAAIAGRRGVSVLLAPAMLRSFGSLRVNLGTWRDRGSDPIHGPAVPLPLTPSPTQH